MDISNNKKDPNEFATPESFPDGARDFPEILQ